MRTGRWCFLRFNVDVVIVFVLLDAANLVACFSFYQFEQFVSERLTDSEWRRLMGIQVDDDGYFNSENSIAMPKWAEKFALSFDRIYKK